MATGQRRGCGTREQGAAYMEVPTGPHGKPVEYFLKDPPVPIDAKAIGLSAIGVLLIKDPEREYADVLDWVGSGNYPHVPDFVEEVRAMGVSRKIARTTDFSVLGPGSRLFLCHSAAMIVNHREYYDALLRLAQTYDGFGRWSCPKDKHPVQRGVLPPPDECCAGLWWHDTTGGHDYDQQDGTWLRSIADVTYRCRPRPDVVPQYALAIFAAFPLRQVAVIRAADGSHELTEHAVRQSKLNVTLEDA